MQTSSVIMVGNFEVPFTPSLREFFSQTHDVMSGSRPIEEQFSWEEQDAMYQVCWVFGDDDKVIVDETEANLLELLHYLTENAVPVPSILAGVRCYGSTTRAVATRICIAQSRQRDEVMAQVADEQAEMIERTALENLFLAPAFKNTTAA